jgi:hypothetical protein
MFSGISTHLPSFNWGRNQPIVSEEKKEEQALDLELQEPLEQRIILYEQRVVLYIPPHANQALRPTSGFIDRMRSKAPTMTVVGANTLKGAAIAYTAEMSAAGLYGSIMASAQVATCGGLAATSAVGFACLSLASGSGYAAVALYKKESTWNAFCQGAVKPAQLATQAARTVTSSLSGSVSPALASNQMQLIEPGQSAVSSVPLQLLSPIDLDQPD